MDPQSPPKRMTRARAAAKASESTSTTANTRTTKIVTAAAKAKATRTATAAPASTIKRKLRSEEADLDDEHDELELDQPQSTTMKPTRAARGRPKKTAETQSQEVEAPENKQGAGPARAARGRATTKKAAPEPPKEEPTRATRTTRAKKTQPEEEQLEIKKPARGRAATTAKPAAVKKTVKFEEPEKENIAPAATTKRKTAEKGAESASGLRAKPLRRPATARSTRTSSRTGTTAGQKEEEEKAPTPLSPKKVTQVRAARRDVESDDELGGTEKTPLNPLLRSPQKLPREVVGTAMKAASNVDGTAESAGLNASGLASVVLGSPARRPPPSPFKDALKSPPRRVGAIPSLGLSATKQDSQAPQSPLKASLFSSPARRPQFPLKAPEASAASNRDDTIRSPFKASSLFQSPAKRPLSPMKMLSPSKPGEAQDVGRSPAPKPTLLATPVPLTAAELAEPNEAIEGETEGVLQGMDQGDSASDSPTRLRFPGRLSAVLPRHADPALKEENMLVVTEEQHIHIGFEQTPDLGDPMDIDVSQFRGDTPAQAGTAPRRSPNESMGMFSLRPKDLNPLHDGDSESEDELTTGPVGTTGSPHYAVPSTPCPAGYSRTPKSTTGRVSISGQTTAKRPRMDQYGFTPLAEQLSNWQADSPSNGGGLELSSDRHAGTPRVAGPQAAEMTRAVVEESPMKSTFFEDEMSVRPQAVTQEAVEAVEAAIEDDSSENDSETPVFDDITVTREDMALAAEANEMSLMEPERLDEMINTQNPDDAASEASQEYGDENAIPIDPALLQTNSSPEIPPVTPQRVMTRTFHTTSKVPLKPADESTPRPVIKKRSHSISRLPTAVQRPTRSLTRNATVISYSPSKKDRQQGSFEAAVAQEEEAEQHRADSLPPATPSKSEAAWSTVGTPARTPRRDLDPALLRGAVVFVDVHTTEGADASGIFVELLTQMGARCVKNWSWNPSSPTSSDGSGSSSSRIGITHVVYKDGGKRTMEKVRESGGVVQCVGVSWVLDCERKNEWLDEAPYYIDTSMVPRGGARRRKSMEPRAIASLNEMLVSSPAKTRQSTGSGRECQTAPSTPANRRDSALWIRTPEDDSLHEDDESEWDGAGLLTPLPRTPAPEAIARFAAGLADDPSTPTGLYEDDDAGSYAAREEELMTRTCPPKTSSSVYDALGDGILAREKDERVLMRLMAARRKSLQFAPKVGSPLARAWN